MPATNPPTSGKAAQAPPRVGSGRRRPTKARRFALWLVLAPVDRVLRFVAPRYRAFFWLISRTPPRVLAALGTWRAERAADQAMRRVPAYQEFTDTASEPAVNIGRLRIPLTEKDNYVLRYPVAARCRDGILPSDLVTIDESSGSSGTPFNWVRSSEERLATHLFISHFARYCFGPDPFVAINAFSMGAWATGINMGAALERTSVVKNTGPDPDKIFRTLAFLGKGHRYLICGYPPFLKHLMDRAGDESFPLDEYRLIGLVGGEGMSEGLRDYLSKTFDGVYSGYGATDIEIGLAGETPLSVAIRRLARRDQRVRRALFGDDSRLPMVFQYNPLSHHVTATEEGELVFTINRREVLAPRIAYNIKDEGGVARFDELEERLGGVGVDLDDIAPSSHESVHLPFLWVYGRRDSTVSVMGANLYPEDVEQALYAAGRLATITKSFCVGSEEQQDGTIRPSFYFEVTVPPDDTLVAEFERQIFDGVFALNADFREAVREHPAVATPIIGLFREGDGPFAADADRIKQVRVMTSNQ